MSEHHTEMFTSQDYGTPSREWGYQCSTCGHEGLGYPTLTEAETAADQHVEEAKT